MFIVNRDVPACWNCDEILDDNGICPNGCMYDEDEEDEENAGSVE
jgi:hypothetical protein